MGGSVNAKLIPECYVSWELNLVTQLKQISHVCFGQIAICTEVQKQNTTQVQIRQAVPPNHAPPGLTVIACVSIKDSQKDN